MVTRQILNIVAALAAHVGQVNNEIVAEPGDDIEQLLSDARLSNTWGVGVVRLKPGTLSDETTYDLSDTLLPILLP